MVLSGCRLPLQRQRTPADGPRCRLPRRAEPEELKQAGATPRRWPAGDASVGTGEPSIARCSRAAAVAIADMLAGAGAAGAGAGVVAWPSSVQYPSGMFPGKFLGSVHYPAGAPGFGISIK